MIALNILTAAALPLNEAGVGAFSLLLDGFYEDDLRGVTATGKRERALLVEAAVIIANSLEEFSKERIHGEG